MKFNGSTPGPLTGQTVQIRKGRLCGWGGATAVLQARYMHMGAYWAKIKGRSWEVVLRPDDWEAPKC